MRTRALFAPLAVVLLASAGCQDGPSAPAEATHLASIVPAGGAAGVDPNAPVTIRFTHSMMAGMEQYVALHEGDVTGPVVAGSWSWSEDRTRLTFTPGAPLEPRTRYTVHVGGGMRDAGGDMIGLGEHCQGMGGQTMGGGGMMGGDMMSGGMMGDGWRHADGTYGMTFSFTTA